MKTSIFSLLLCISICTLPSCNKSNPAGPSGSQQIIPLNLGNNWSMHYTVYDTAGAERQTINDTFKITTDTVVAGDTWYTIASEVFSTLYLTSKSDGIWTSGTSVAGAPIFKYPANVGDNWTAQVDTSTTFQISVQSTNDPVGISNGGYTCYEYRLMENSRPYADIYLSAGVGFVMMNLYSTTNSGQPYLLAHGELVSYVLR